jgi:signal transduction histidine kinase/DNA-binding response OmpR family regulator
MISNLSLKALLSIILITAFFGTPLKNAESRDAITVAGVTDKPPLEQNTQKFGPAGIYVELWKIWSKKTGVQVNYIITTPDAAENALRNGGVDVIMGYTLTSENMKYFSVISDIYISEIYIYRNRKISSAESLAELPPFRVGVTDCIASQIDRMNYEILFLLKNSVPELISAVEKGEVNVFIAESSIANYELTKNGLWKDYIQSAEPAFRRGVSAAVRSGDDELIQLISTGFSRISGTEKLLAERTWAGGNFKYRIPWGFIATIFVIAAVIGGVAVVWWWNYQLQSKIGRATKELTVLKEEAEAASTAKSRFLDNISHELRTPLTLILAPVEDALKGKQLEKSTLEMIRRNSFSLLTLINDLLDISRISSGKMNLEVSETDLCAAVRLYCAEMESASEHRGLELACSLPDEPVMAFIDTKKFSRIISNFFSNSFKFTKRGGRITLSVENTPDNVILKFRDTGNGIPASKINSMFNLFTQCGTEASDNYEGTGIGLAIVKEIAELHGGSVSAESRHIDDHPDDHGTELTVSLPSGIEHLKGRDDVIFIDNSRAEFLLPFARVISAAHEKFIQADRSDKTEIATDDLPSVLVVEDNDDMLRFIEQLLSGEYQVYTASNGEEALEILKHEETIDLIISDVMMPVMDGHEFVKRIMPDERFDGVPVIFLTARGDDFSKHEALKLGAVDYVTKPFNSNELRLRIKNQMEMRIMRNNLKRKNEELYSKLKNHIDSKKTAISGDIKRKLESICEFIIEHCTENLSREDLASASDMNPDTFSRMFNQHTGKTLPDYINELRINEVKRRLNETDHSITRICFDTGFDSIRTFNRAFKKFTGKTPGGFRDGEVEN